MLLPKFDYYEPQNMQEACKLIAKLKADAKIIAGGTDLLVNMKNKKLSPKCLVSLAGIPDLTGIEEKKKTFSIGSHAIIALLKESKAITLSFPALAEAASVLGSPLVRNRATVGGNIVTARPAADLVPPLIAYDAKLVLASKDKKREISLEDFMVGPGQTKIKPAEILTKIVLTIPPPNTGSSYIKLMHRRSLEIAIVAVVSRITLDKKDGIIKTAKIILSAVAPKAIHAVSAEKILIGEKPSEALFAQAAALAMKDCKPITDIRGGKVYRHAMVEVLTKRTLSAALKRAQGK